MGASPPAVRDIGPKGDGGVRIGYQCPVEWEERILRGPGKVLWTIAVWIVGMIGVTVLFAPDRARAQVGFRQIADSEGLALEAFDAAKLNDAGTVVFFARLQGEDVEGLFSGSDPTADTVVDTRGAFTAILGHALGPDGTVVFLARTASGFGLYTGPDPTADLFVAGGDTFPGLGGIASVNGAGTIAFHGATGEAESGHFTGPNPGTDTLVDNSGPFESFLSQPVMNDGGEFAFVAKLDDVEGEDEEVTTGATGVFAGPDPEADLIADTSGTFQRFTSLSPSINSSGEVVFRGETVSAQGIYRGPDPELDQIADSAGDYGVFGEAAINDAGTVVFQADLDSGGTGIFTGPDPMTDAVIRTGDTLFGAAVTDLLFWGHGALNNQGEIAFVYELETGAMGVAVAPEPGAAALSVTLVAALGACAAPRLRRRSPGSPFAARSV